MALDAILSAISQKTDSSIAIKREMQKKAIADLKQANEDAMQSLREQIQKQCDQKKKAILTKSKNHATMVVKNAELLKKQELLDALYAKVIQRFDTLPEKEVEALFVEMLKKLPTSGILHVSKKHAKILKKIAPNFQEGNPLEESGFILETEIADYDCRISTLVQEQVRPKTEISLSHSLFL